MNRSRIRPLLASFMLSLSYGTATAAFIPVEDFDSLVPGPINGQAGWTAPAATSVVAVDPDDSANQILMVVTESTYLRRPLPVADGTTRMLFLRLRYEDQLAASFGLSGSNYPTQFGDFEVELGLTNTGSELRVNDDGHYRDVALLASGRWYACWVLVDNSSDVIAIWLHDRAGEAATDADRLSAAEQDLFAFRSAPAGDLRTFFIKTGGGSGIAGPLLLDDLHVEDTAAANLDNPTAVTTSSFGDHAVAPTLAVFPNPANPQVVVRVSLPEPQSMQLQVHDLRGRLVCTLADGPVDAGPHEFLWDGRDLAERILPAGIYLVRASSPSGTRLTRLTLLR